MSEKLKEIERRVKSLFSLWIDPEKVEKLDIKTSLDEKGVLLEISGPREVLSLIIGRKGSTVAAVRKILKSIGGALRASISLKVHTPK
jgi:predicted RNA-binding protein YlqC (UPF0109 family)